MTLDYKEKAIVRFNKIVLGWDCNILLDPKKNAALSLHKVKDKYSDVRDYISTFEPLLFEEVKAQIVQNVQAQIFPRKDEKKVTTCKSVSVLKWAETDGFHLLEVICLVPKTAVSVSQNDLLLLSNEKFQEGTKLSETHAFALVEQVEKREEGEQMDDVYLLGLRMYFVREANQVLKDVSEPEPCPRLLKMRSLIISSYESSRCLEILKICSLSTIVREYVALWSINTLSFKDLILTAAERIPSSDDKAWKISGLLKEYIEDNLNPSQQAALNAGLSRKDFVLIQGPPGTGKTQTILGLLSSILHATPARVGLNTGSRVVKRQRELPILKKCEQWTLACEQWTLASPWLKGMNPRDIIMPNDGDDGFFPTSGNEFKPEVVNCSRKHRKRVLVCAPSNSALDEIVMRLLSTGVRDESNHAYNPKIVRVGLKPHYSVRGVYMDDLVAQKLAVHMAADKQKHGAQGRDLDSIRALVLDEAAIVFSTLSFSGSSVFTKLNRDFDVVIIDEAAQAVEPATLIPLGNGCKQVFLVGDPVQLPATVISSNAESYGYRRSLFERLQSAGYPVVMLKTQYRMHPEIRSFASEEFYDGALEDGDDIMEKTGRDWHRYRCFGPFCFFDITGKEYEASGRGSWVNEDEVEFVLLMYDNLVGRYPVLKSSSQLAIICPYRHQVKLFEDRFNKKLGLEREKFVDINTVDGFQGREKDVVIFSCVRSSKDRSIGFMSDYRRMNVGITRARASVLVVGSASTLKEDVHWKNLVESAKKRNSFFEVPKPYESFFRVENLNTMVLSERAQENQGEQNMDEPGPIYGNPDDVPTELEPDDDQEFGDGEADVRPGYDED